MPIYEFLCSDCGDIIEEIHPIDRHPETIKCKCGGSAERQISTVNWILKGPGDHWPSKQVKRKGEGARNNEAAGKKGRGEWRERSPKLVYR